MNEPTPEESAAIVAALEIFFPAQTATAGAPARELGMSRWRRAGRVHQPFENERFTPGLERERRS